MRERWRRGQSDLRPIAVFCSGYGSNFQAILDAVRRKKLKARIALMICNNPKAYALKRARRAKIPVCLISPGLFRTRRGYEEILAAVLKSQDVELVALAGFMRILTPYFIRAYRNRILNIHPSLLPAFRGAHAIRDAFEAGAKETGVTVHLVTEKMDAGPILLQKTVKIAESDTLKTLEAKIHKVEHQIYPRAIQARLH